MSKSSVSTDRPDGWLLWVALLACAGLAGPMMGRAGGEASDPRALGTAEALLDYCSKADPSSAEQLRYRILRLTQGASPEELAKMRNSDEYRRPRDAESDFLSKVDPHNAKKVCSGSPATKQ